LSRRHAGGSPASAYGLGVSGRRKHAPEDGTGPESRPKLAVPRSPPPAVPPPGPPAGPPSAVDHPRSHPPQRTGPVWLLSAAVVTGGLAVHVAATHEHDVLNRRFAIVWPLLAVGFFLAEFRPVHLRFRIGAHSLSLSEIPLTLGLFFTSANGLLAAQLVGGALALAYRRQKPVKLAFNLACFLFEVVIAVAAFRAVIGTGHPLGAGGWAAAFVAGLVAGLVGHLSVAIAMLVSQGELQLGQTLRNVGLGLAGTLINTSFGLVAVLVLWEHPTGIWLLGVPAAALAAAYRAYISERTRRDRLEFLYTASRLVQSSDEFGEAIVSLLRHTREMFHAEVVELSVRPSPDNELLLRTALGPGDEMEVLNAVSPESAGPVVTLVSGRRDAVLVTDTGECDRLTGGRDAGLRAVMAAPLHGERRMVGTFLVGRGHLAVADFDTDELRLFETLANQVSIVLENGQLGHSLARLKTREQRLVHQAFHDSLTNLANRASFVERARTALVRSKAKDIRSAVLFIDLDDFKAINDELGHGTGDQVLVVAAERIHRCVRPSDVAARLGGDEFAILLEDVEDGSAGIHVAERVLTAFRDPIEVAGRRLLVQPSVGVAFSEGCADVQEFLGNADSAMYAAKRSGKGCFRFFEPASGAPRTPPDDRTVAD
jgi:diguanylate cyclase (GGDEF)-like protein